MTRCPRCQRRLSISGDCAEHGRPTAVDDVIEVPFTDVSPPAGWKLGRVLAVGGTAVVYELEGPTQSVLKLALRSDRETRQRFEREAQILRDVGAPTTPALVDHGTVKTTPYLIMEHLGTETLGTWMARHGATGGFGEIIAFLTHITTSLARLHDAGYVHRDLKPENVSIGSRGLRLLDFGLAKSLSRPAQDTEVGAIVGTPHYMAPERIRTGGNVDHRADIYSFGVIAFEMFAGVPPFVGERRAIEYQHQVARPPSLRETRALPQQLDEIVMACLAKEPDARPSSALELRKALTAALTSIDTIRGVGATLPAPPVVPAGQQADVALAWIVGGDPVALARAITERQGMVIRQRGDSMLAAFKATQHDSPLDVALAATRDLVGERGGIALHVTSALVRRSARGKSMAYGRELDRIEDWIPATRFTGMVLTAAAAERAKGMYAAPDVPGFFRASTNPADQTTDVEAPFVGRARLLDLIANATANPVLVNISGDEGSGKSRIALELVARLRASGREVIDARVRRRFLGDRADDDRVLQACGSADIGQAIAAAAARRAVLVIDDADRLSAPLREALLRDGLPLARVLTSSRPMFEVLGDVEDRLAIDLPALAAADAAVLLRHQLRPCRLIPDVLIDRFVVRGLGNPRLLLALVRDLKYRGAVRRHSGSDEWYVAADELDTLLAAPGPAWVALRAVEELPAELAPVLRICAGLGPRFCADEVAHATGMRDSSSALEHFVRAEAMSERNGWYAFEDAALQDALYQHVLDERRLVHAAALEYWLAHPGPNHLGWLARVAHHATAVGDRNTGVACWLALARAAERRGELDQAALAREQARALIDQGLPPVVRAEIDAVDDE